MEELLERSRVVPIERLMAPPRPKNKKMMKQKRVAKGRKTKGGRGERETGESRIHKTRKKRLDSKKSKKLASVELLHTKTAKPIEREKVY